MPKFALGSIILLCLATSTGCWFIYTVEYQRLGRETREREVTERAALESEMYQAWHFAMRYEAFGGPLGRSKEWPKDTKPYDRRDVWVKSFQRSDVKTVRQIIIGLQDRISDAIFRELVSRRAPISVFKSARSEVWHHLAVQCRAEKMDGPGDWIVSDWTFSAITYTGDFPFHLAKSGE